MSEQVVRGFYYFQVHLLYASVVGLSAWALTSVRQGSAATKYWIWVGASLNFVLPVGALVDRFSAYRLTWAAPLRTVGAAADRIARGPAAGILLAVWLLGTVLMLARLGLRLRAELRCGRSFSRSLRVGGVPVRFAGRQAPAVDGVLRPRISLPEGIDGVLSQRELDAVLIHELTHARRRDNLVRLLYEAGLCALWFHPLVWIAGSRLALYRELSCDESVIRKSRGGDLVSALAKLAVPERPFLLRATASSFLGPRLDRLTSAAPAVSRRASALLAALFGAILLVGVLETVAHTACCFLLRH